MIVQQLEALGYLPQDLQQQLEQAEGALEPLCNQLVSADLSVALAVLTAAQQQLAGCWPALPSRMPATTQPAGTCVVPQRLSWWVAAAAYVLGAAQPATAAGFASVRHGVSTACVPSTGSSIGSNISCGNCIISYGMA